MDQIGKIVKLGWKAREQMIQCALELPDGTGLIYEDLRQGLWRQDFNQTKPERIKGFANIKFYNFAFLPNSKDMIFSSAEEAREIVIAENFR